MENQHTPETNDVNEETVISPEHPTEPTGQSPQETPAEAPAEQFHEELLEDLSSYEEGKIVEGTVIEVAEDSVFVDIGYKSEGEIRKSEFNRDPHPGDSISVMIMKMENREGKLVLSKQKADDVLKWESIADAHRQGNPVEGKVVSRNKGGYTVLLNDTFEAFLPNSQAGLRRVEDPQSLLGKVLSFKVDKIERKNNVVLSHRKYLEEEKERRAREFFSTCREGDEITGTVKDLVSYGAFVDLGGLDGLLHVNDLSWGRVKDPKKHLSRGESVTCKILSIDQEKGRVSLGLKQMVSDPWLSFEQRYEKNKVYSGRVTKLANFGAFVELEPGIEGLLHVSELSWTRRINHPKDVLKTGEQVSVMILDYDMDKRTVSLGLKQVLPNPWDDIDVRYPVGSQITGKVNKVTKFGAFIELEEGIDGLLHVDDMSWTKQVKNPSDLYKKGDKVDARIIAVDTENRRIKLGVKQLHKNPWKTLKEKHPRGSVVTGTVTSIVDFGVFVQVDEDIEGLVHISQLANERVEDPHSRCKVGDELKATVIDIDEEKKKISLSVKNYMNNMEAKELNKYLEDESKDGDSVTIGDLIDLSNIGE